MADVLNPRAQVREILEGISQDSQPETDETESAEGIEGTSVDEGLETSPPIDQELETADAVEGKEEDENPEVDQQASPKTFSELAEYLGFPDDFFYSYKINMPDGEEPLTLGELKDRARAASTGTTEAEALREELLAEKTQFTAYQQAFQEHGPMLHQAQANMQRLKKAWDSINWDALEKKDASKAVLERDKLRDQYRMAAAQAQQADTAIRDATQSYITEIGQREWQKVVEKRPDWKDPAKAKEGVIPLFNAAKSFGFTDSELNMIQDARMIDILEFVSKAMSAQKIDMKAVRKKTATLKPGKPTSPKETRSRANKELLDAAASETNFRKKAALLSQANLIR